MEIVYILPELNLKKTRIKHESIKNGVYPALKHYGNTYRIISIKFIIVKLLMNIILNRLSALYENQHLTIQFGFDFDKGCNSAIYLIKKLFNRKLYCCLVDVTAAYDQINRNFLLSFIGKGLPSCESNESIGIVEDLYQSANFRRH